MTEQKQEPQLPLPEPDDETKEFFDGARRGVLRLLHCNGCGIHYLPGTKACSECWSEDLEWVDASGRGTVFTFSAMHQRFHPAFAELTPYNIAVIDLEEGPRMYSNLVEIESEHISVGLPVEVVFDQVSDEIAIPRFRPRAVD